ncbi:MAG: HAD-IA family hydrolase [Candidatus Bathyarchaeota archaeon]|nr:HAD-IA family hydrolase [Candidatus Bathyarchaeota archaeon]
MTPKIEAIVFDLDATLVNLGGKVEWRQAHQDIVQAYIEHGCDEDDVQACSVKGLFTMLEEMWEINKGNRDDAEEVQKNAYQILSDYEQHGSQQSELMEGCIETLDWVKEQGLPMGVCTSNSQESAEKAIEVQGLAHYFEAVIGRSTLHRMKPYPDQLLACFEKLGVKASNGVMIGDSHKDVLAGKAAGSYTVAIPVYFTRLDRVKEAKPDVIINSLHELPNTLKTIRG